MHDPALEHDRDGLESPMRMVWKAADVICWVIGMKAVQEDERIKMTQAALSDDSGDSNTGAFEFIDT